MEISKMKKFAVLAIGLLVIGAWFVMQRQPIQRESNSAAESLPLVDSTAGVATQKTEPLAGDTVKNASTDDRRSLNRQAVGLFSTLVSQELTLEGLEAFAKAKGFPLDKATKGHPKTGQRLEVTLATPYAIQIVFDLKTNGQPVFQAARMQFPTDSDLNALKEDVKAYHPEAIASESDEKLIFADNQKGETLWVGRVDDGRVQMALELNIHPHDHGGP